jgi:hypothetical protein
MTTPAELLVLVVLGAALFRLARPLRDRLEGWFARSRYPHELRGRVIDLQRRNGGAHGAEDPDGD